MPALPSDHDPRPPLPRAVTFEATRDAVRQLLAAHAGRLAPGDAPSAGHRQQIVELCGLLRSLQLLDEAGLAQVRHRCAAALAGFAGPPRTADRRPALDLQESDRIFAELIAPGLLDPCRPSPQPDAVLVGAHLGCGRAEAMACACTELGGPAAAALVLLEDLRAFHPGYAGLMRQDPKLAAYYTESDALRWLDMALHAAAARRLPLVLEPAMRTADAVAAAFGHLRQAGYRIEARALAVPHAASWLAIMCVQELVRLECGVGRTFTSAAHQATYDGLPLMLERIEREPLAHRVTVYDREGRCRFAQDLPHRPGGAGAAATQLQVLRALPLSLEELRVARDTCLWLERLVHAPQRAAGNEDLLRTEAMRWEAECALLAHAFLTVPQAQCLQEFPQLGAAFEILGQVREGAAVLPPPQDTLLVKRAAEGIARRISHGNLTLPAPWLTPPAAAAG